LSAPAVCSHDVPLMIFPWHRQFRSVHICLSGFWGLPYLPAAREQFLFLLVKMLLHPLSLPHGYSLTTFQKRKYQIQKFASISTAESPQRSTI
jgi:hypothetical protein